MEIVLRALAAWNADNFDAFMAELDPEVEWHPSIEPALEGGDTVYRGYDGARRAWDEYRGEAWAGLRGQIQETRDLGDSVLVLGHFDVTGRRTGIEFGRGSWAVHHLPRRADPRSRDFLATLEALEAAGLLE